jgi:hypothetical protein
MEDFVIAIDFALSCAVVFFGSFIIVAFCLPN